MSVYAIKGRIIDGISDVALEQGLLVFSGEEISYVGPVGEYEVPADATVIYAGEGTVLPGFIDCHTHLSGGEGSPLGSMSHFDSLLTAAHQLGFLLDAGFTYLRDMSLFGAALARAVRRGELRGPGIMPGGRMLSPTAGHSDTVTAIAPEIVQQLNTVGYLADGLEGCLRAVRMQFRDGAEFIKICATGGVSSAVDGLDDVQFSDEEIAVICAEAARHGTYVAAHCSNAAGTEQALENGVLCIEHGIELSDRCIELMVDKNAPLITTLFVSQLVATHPEFPDYMREKGKKASITHGASMLKARDAGIRIALGTDFSNSKNTPYLGNGMEFEAITNVGFTPMEAIKIGTINGAYVCKAEDRIGSLEAGKQADIVVVDGNPLEDIRVLGHAEHVKLVVRQGHIEKNRL